MSDREGECDEDEAGSLDENAASKRERATCPGGATPKLSSSASAPSGGGARPKLSSSASAPSGGGARPKVRKPPCSSSWCESSRGCVVSSLVSCKGVAKRSRAAHTLQAADLPKSFYHESVQQGSHTQAAGQSNLSTEVAAIIQSQLAHNTRPNSPPEEELDFLEMDFDDSDDSGQGGDENVTEDANEPEEETVKPETQLSTVPDNLNIKLQEEEQIKYKSSDVTPVREKDLLLGMMVRSRSLNSPLSGGGKLLGCHLARGDSDPLVPLNQNHLRHLSGGVDSGGGSHNFDLDMEICGARLQQRETLFGVPGATGNFKIDQGIQEPQSNVIEKTMIWTELEACQRQTNQIGPSSCGPTAVINVLSALDISYNVDQVAEMRARLRAPDSAPLSEYLFSRSVAGTTHKDLIESIEMLTNGRVFCRFFATYPQRRLRLSSWLAHWLQRGAVPILTLNLQRGVRAGAAIPDAWHHQMVFGVGPAGIYLTNPLESVSEKIIFQQLSSPSLLLVRRNDILSRHDRHCNSELGALRRHPDERWDRLNVLGQVVNMLREEQAFRGDRSKPANRGQLTQHLRIPAAYDAGISLFMRRDSPYMQDLVRCPEFPLLSCEEDFGAKAKS